MKWINKNLPGWSQAEGGEAKRQQKGLLNLDNFTVHLHDAELYLIFTAFSATV